MIYCLADRPEDKDHRHQRNALACVQHQLFLTKADAEFLLPLQTPTIQPTTNAWIIADNGERVHTAVIRNPQKS